MDPTRASVLSSNFFLLFQIIVIQKEPDHPSFLIDIKSKGTFSSKKEPIGKVWYIAVDVGVNGNSGSSELFRKWRDQCNFHRAQIVSNE